MVDVCGLFDLRFTGRSWTFEKQVAGGSFCRVRLDRALASPDLSAIYPDVVVENQGQRHQITCLSFCCGDKTRADTRGQKRSCSDTRSCGRHMRSLPRLWHICGSSRKTLRRYMVCMTSL